MTVSVQQSQPLTLECAISGSSAPAAKWFKNGKEVTAESSPQRQHNNLVFVKVATSDEGSYTCTAETEQGTVVSANYTVNVLGKKKRKSFALHGNCLQQIVLWRKCFISFLHRACVYHRGPDQPARLSWLLCSLCLHSERKPVPKYHLAVQRSSRLSIAALSDLRILPYYNGRDTTGWGSVSVSAGQWCWFSTVIWNTYDTVRYVSLR